MRVSAPGRFEYRSVDSMVNPYLMGSTLLAAMDDGMDNNLDPGEPEERNIYEAMEAGKQVKKLPMSLGEALTSSRRTTRSSSAAMPGEMYRLYMTSTSATTTLHVHRDRLGQVQPQWSAP